jgi:hypothetical protein
MITQIITHALLDTFVPVFEHPIFVSTMPTQRHRR